MTLDDYNINFSMSVTAADCLGHMSEIAHDYGIVTVADAIGNYVKPIYGLHSKLYWTEDDLEQAKIVTVDDHYTIELPEPRHQTEYEYPAPDPETSALNIVLHTNEVSDPDAVLAEIFKYVYTVKDRTINITIM